MFQMLPLLPLLLFLTSSVQGQDLTEQLCPERYEHPTDGWAVKLDRKWIQIDKEKLALLDGMAKETANDLPVGTKDLLGHSKEFHSWKRLPRFIPRAKLESLTPIGAFGVHVNTNRSGTPTRNGLKTHRMKYANAVVGSAAFFNREGESKLVEQALVEIDGARTLRVLVSTVFPDKGGFFLESWTVPGRKRYFTIYMLYPKAYREVCSRSMRSFLNGFEGIHEVKSQDPGKKLELTWGIILIFLLPFLVIPIIFFRSYKRPAPPQA